MAEAENLPLAYLERIAALLKKPELIKATRGAHGGYLLARPAEEITMDAVVLALEGAIAPMDCFFDDRDGRVSCSHHTDGGTAPPSCCGPACRWASSSPCSAPPWPSSSSSPTERRPWRYHG